MPVTPVASRVTAGYTRNDNSKESNNSLDHCGEHIADTGDNCHNDTADGSEDGLELFGDVVRDGSLFWLAMSGYMDGWKVLTQDTTAPIVKSVYELMKTVVVC